VLARDKIITFIFIVIFLWLVFSFLDKYSKFPSANSEAAALQIPKYPKLTDWQISNQKKLCFYYITRCKEPASIISFSTSDVWSSVYSFYKDTLAQASWQSNSNIVTSIPSSIVLTNTTIIKNTNCEAIISPQNYKMASEQTTDIKSYTVAVTCL